MIRGEGLAVRNLTVIDDRLASAGQPTREQFAAIATAGYEVVINIATPESTGFLADEEAIVQGLGMAYIYLPVSWEAPTLSSLDAFFAVMSAQAPRVVFLHCTANARASAFLYLYRTLGRGVPEAEALADLHRAWHPNANWAAFIERGRQHRAGMAGMLRS